MRDEEGRGRASCRDRSLTSQGYCTRAGPCSCLGGSSHPSRRHLPPLPNSLTPALQAQRNAGLHPLHALRAASHLRFHACLRGGPPAAALAGGAGAGHPDGAAAAAAPGHSWQRHMRRLCDGSGGGSCGGGAWRARRLIGTPPRSRCRRWWPTPLGGAAPRAPLQPYAGVSAH